MVENAWGNNLDRFVNQKQKQRQPFDILLGHVKAPQRFSFLAVLGCRPNTKASLIKYVIFQLLNLVMT